MNPRLTIVTAIALLALAAGYGAYHIARPGACTDCADDKDAGFVWLQREFSPGRAELARIRELHADHQVACAAHCREIARLRGELAALRGSAGTEAAIAAKEAELAAADLRCRNSIRGHVSAIAELLGPVEGARYLSIVLPRLEHFDHQGPPGVEIGKPHGTGSP